MPKVILVANTEWYLYRFRLSLASFLRQHGFEVVLVSPSGPYAALLEQAGFRWHPWEVGRQSLAPSGNPWLRALREHTLPSSGDENSP